MHFYVPMVEDKKIEGISNINDESDREGMRIVVDIKRDANSNVVLNKLFKYSALQSSFSVNNIALVHARELVRLLKGIPCRVNLIRFHSIPNVNLKGANTERMVFLRDYLTENGITSTIRRSRGEDILAACGMLSSAKKNIDSSEQQSAEADNK